MASQLIYQPETNRPWRVFLIFIPTTNFTIKTISKGLKKKKSIGFGVKQFEVQILISPLATWSSEGLGRTWVIKTVRWGVITNTSSAQLFWGLNEMFIQNYSNYPNVDSSIIHKSRKDKRSHVHQQNRIYLYLHSPFMDHGLVVVKGLVQLHEVMSHAMQGHPRQTGHSGEFWQNVVHRKEWQLTPVFLPQKSHEQYEKAKRYDTRR